MPRMIQTSRLFFLASCMVLTVSAGALAGAGSGSINWNEGYVEAMGEGTARFSGNRSKDRINARRAAEARAQRALLETIEGVRITSLTTVRDSMLAEDLIKTRVEGIVKGAQIVREKVEWEMDGSPTVTVVMRLCLMGGTTCQGAPIVQALDPERIPEPTLAPRKIVAQPAPPPPAASMPATDGGNAAEKVRKTYPCDLTKRVTGLVLSLNGKPFERVLMPVVISAKRAEEPLRVYSAKLVKPSVFRSFGAIRYADSVDNAVKQAHVNGNVLVVPVKEITSDNLLLIEFSDAATIRETVAHGNNYLEEAKVVISAQ